MELTNKRTYFNFSHEVNGININGTVEFQDDRISSLNGNFNTEDMQYCNFNYSEIENGTVNKSFNNIPKDFDACAILTEIVDNIKANV